MLMFMSRSLFVLMAKLMSMVISVSLPMFCPCLVGPCSCPTPCPCIFPCPYPSQCLYPCLSTCLFPSPSRVHVSIPVYVSFPVSVCVRIQVCVCIHVPPHVAVPSMSVSVSYVHVPWLCTWIRTRT